MRELIEKAMMSIHAIFVGRRLQDTLTRHRQAADRLDHVVRAVLDPSRRS